MSRRLSILAVLLAFVCILASSCRRKPTPAHVVELLTSESRDDQLEGLDLLAELPRPVPTEVLGPVAALFTSEDWEVQLSAISFTKWGVFHGCFRDEDVPLFAPELVPVLSEGVVNSRSAETILKLCGPRAASAMEPLREMYMSAESDEVRWTCATTMEVIEPGSMQSTIMAGLRNPDRPPHVVRLWTYMRCASDAQVQAIVPVLLEALIEEEHRRAPEDRQDVIEGLESTLNRALKEHPELLPLYQSYLGKGIDSYIATAIAEAGLED